MNPRALPLRYPRVKATPAPQVGHVTAGREDYSACGRLSRNELLVRSSSLRLSLVTHSSYWSWGAHGVRGYWGTARSRGKFLTFTVLRGARPAGSFRNCFAGGRCTWPGVRYCLFPLRVQRSCYCCRPPNPWSAQGRTHLSHAAGPGCPDPGWTFVTELIEPRVTGESSLGKEKKSERLL